MGRLVIFGTESRIQLLSLSPLADVRPQPLLEALSGAPQIVCTRGNRFQLPAEGHRLSSIYSVIQS